MSSSALDFGRLSIWVNDVQLFPKVALERFHNNVTFMKEYYEHYTFLEEVKRNTAEVRCVSERLTKDQKDSDFNTYSNAVARSHNKSWFETSHSVYFDQT